MADAPLYDLKGRPIRYGTYPEITLPAILVGWVLGAVICLSIGYASLKLGFSIEGSELAAILGWGILRGLMRRKSIVENNINQTIASAVNGASAGIMFTLPAVFILARNSPAEFGELANFNRWLMALAAITGGIVGLAFVIPLRKQMIDFNRLAYPGGIAVATILKSPGAGLRKSMYLLGAAVLSGVIHTVMVEHFGDHPDGHLGRFLGIPSVLNITFYLSLMTIGVGFLSGRGGLVFGYGGFICYFVLGPLLSHYGSDRVQALTDPAARQVFMTAGESSTVARAAELLAPYDPDAARQLLTATGAGTIDEARQTLKREDLSAEERQTLTQRIADTVAAGTLAGAGPAAQAVLTAAEALERAATQVADTDAEAAAALRKKTDELLRGTRASAVAKAAAILEESRGTEVRRKVETSETAREQFHLIRAAPGLTGEEIAAVQAATRAADTYYGVPNQLRLQLFRPTGIGMLIGAAIGGIIAAFPLIRSAIRSMQQASKLDVRAEAGETATAEMPIKLLYLAVICGALAMVVIARLSVPHIELGRALAMALLGLLWIWIAGVIVSECVGRTNWSPLSGMTLIGVTILLLVSSGLGGPEAILSSMFVGVAICCAVAQAGDMMLDLKSGYLIGASPKRQQIAQLVGVWLGPLLMLSLITVLHEAYTMGSDRLPAPQATALATTMHGIVGGDAPTWRYAAGTGLGALLAFSGLGGIGVQIGLGFYMPFDIVLTYTIGCVGRIIVERVKGISFVEHVGIPMAAGLIVGEALVGVGHALMIIVGGAGQ